MIHNAEDIKALETAIKWHLSKDGQSPRYAMKDPHEAVDKAVQQGDVALLRCYLKSVVAGCGVAGAHFMVKDLRKHGIDTDLIVSFVVPWRIDLRLRLLNAARNSSNRSNWITTGYSDCIIRAYTAPTEQEAESIASIITDREVSDTHTLEDLIELVAKHHPRLSEGAL